MEIFSIVNQKGGVGKTLTSMNLAIGLAKKGQRVLAIDLDPQGSLSISLGLQFPDDEKNTLSTAIDHLRKEEEFDPHKFIRTHPEGIDFIPSNIELVNSELDLVSAMNREYILSRYLDSIYGEYDMVILDCSPSLGLITTNALACSQHVIIPIQAHYLSVKGMEQLFRTISQVKRRLNRNLEICGILVTMANTCTKEYKETMQSLDETYGDEVPVFDSIIPLSTKASETPRFGKSIYLHDPRGKVATAYLNLVNELVEETDDLDEDSQVEYEENDDSTTEYQNETLPSADEYKEVV